VKSLRFWKWYESSKLISGDWVHNLGFLVVLTAYLNELNLKLQGENHLVYEL
jgi:hypothetical protein